MWEELQKVNLKNKEKYLDLFRDLIKQIKNRLYDFKDREEKDYFIVNEKRMNSQFVTIVPKELISLYNKMKENAPDEFLGFTILINDIRVSCFGVPCSILSKAIIN